MDLIKMVLDSNWVDLSEYTERKAAEKISNKIKIKKQEIITKLNDGFSDNEE